GEALPIYTYKCQDCGADLEKRQGFDDAPLTTCVACGGRLRRTLHSVGIIFKGSGFYNTDYRGTNGANGAKKDEAKGDGKSKGDDKPKADDKAAASSPGTATASSDGAAKGSAEPTKTS